MCFVDTSTNTTASCCRRAETVKPDPPRGKICSTLSSSCDRSVPGDLYIQRGVRHKVRCSFLFSASPFVRCIGTPAGRMYVQKQRRLHIYMIPGTWDDIASAPRSRLSTSYGPLGYCITAHQVGLRRLLRAAQRNRRAVQQTPDSCRAAVPPTQACCRARAAQNDKRKVCPKQPINKRLRQPKKVLQVQNN